MTAAKFNRDELERMWAEGATLAQIRDHFGYACTGSVSGVVARLGLPKRNPVGETAQRDADILEDHRNGASVAELMRDYSLSKSRISRILADGRAANPPEPSNVRVKAWSCSPAAVYRYFAQKGARA